jgi:hypothetical protein
MLTQFSIIHICCTNSQELTSLLRNEINVQTCIPCCKFYNWWKFALCHETKQEEESRCTSNTVFVIHIGYNELTEQKKTKNKTANKVLFWEMRMHKLAYPRKFYNWWSFAFVMNVNKKKNHAVCWHNFSVIYICYVMNQAEQKKQNKIMLTRFCFENENAQKTCIPPCKFYNRWKFCTLSWTKQEESRLYANTVFYHSHLL